MDVLNEQSVDYNKIADKLHIGGIIIYPTDTAYALGCDGTNSEAVEKIFKIKGRNRGKTLSLIVASRAMAEEWLEFSPAAGELADKFWPGPLTLVLPVKKEGLTAATVKDGCAAGRVPASEIARELSQSAGVPLVATSANASGQGPGYNLAAVEKSIGDKLSLVDLAIDNGQLPERGVSTMVKVWDNEIKVLRQGVVVIPSPRGEG